MRTVSNGCWWPWPCTLSLCFQCCVKCVSAWNVALYSKQQHIVAGYRIQNERAKIISLEALSADPPYECVTVHYELMHLDASIMFIFGASSVWRVPFIRTVDDGSQYIQNSLDVWTHFNGGSTHATVSNLFVSFSFLFFLYFSLILHNHIFEYNTSSLAAWERRLDLIHFSMRSCDFHFVFVNEFRALTNWHAQTGSICI